MNVTPSSERDIKCVMCGKTIAQKTQVLVEMIEGNNYTFDSKDCILFFKKFKSLYGSNFNV